MNNDSKLKLLTRESFNGKSTNTIVFEDEEIKKSTLEELLFLKISVYNYLKCRKLKNRNLEFLNLYGKIEKEINQRSNLNEAKLIQTKPSCPKEKSFLGRKYSFSESLLDLKIPHFLNDKPQEVEKKESSESSVSENEDEVNLVKFKQRSMSKKKSNKCMKGNFF